MNDKVVFLAYRTDKADTDGKEVLACARCKNKAWTVVYDDQAAREKQAVEQVEVAERRQAQEAALQTLLGSADDREAFLRLINGG